MNETNDCMNPTMTESAVLGPTFEKGKPSGESMGKWNQKLGSRNEIIKYLQTGQRYFYSQDWFGSEKRKNPA